MLLMFAEKSLQFVYHIHTFPMLLIIINFISPENFLFSGLIDLIHEIESDILIKQRCRLIEEVWIPEDLH